MGSERACAAESMQLYEVYVYVLQSLQFCPKGRRGRAGGVSQLYWLESVDVGSVPIKQQRYLPWQQSQITTFQRGDLCVGSGCQGSHVVLVQ